MPKNTTTTRWPKGSIHLVSERAKYLTEEAANLHAAIDHLTNIIEKQIPQTTEYGRSYRGMGNEILPIGTRPPRATQATERYKRKVTGWEKISPSDYQHRNGHF